MCTGVNKSKKIDIIVSKSAEQMEYHEQIFSWGWECGSRDQSPGDTSVTVVTKKFGDSALQHTPNLRVQEDVLPDMPGTIRDDRVDDIDYTDIEEKWVALSCAVKTLHLRKHLQIPSPVRWWLWQHSSRGWRPRHRQIQTGETINQNLQRVFEKRCFN